MPEKAKKIAGFTGCGKTHSELQEVSGHDFSRAANDLESTLASQAAEKLDKSAIHGTVLKGHDFNRAINTLK